MQNIQETYSDLFSASEDFCLVHCVSRDFHMGKGIALEFRNRFGRVNELLAQNPNIGGFAVLCANNQYVFYLVTKERYFHKPSYEDLRNSLENMKNFCIANNLNKIAMPKIGCGLDRLNWQEVLNILHQIFDNTGVYIRVYIFGN